MSAELGFFSEKCCSIYVGLKVREALEIRRHNCGPGHGLNEDMGAYVKTSLWNPVFHRMNSEDGRGEGTSP